jgi:hypothetical protein
MKWRPFTVAAALSCLLAAAVAACWLRSYWVYDQVSCGSTPDGYQCAWKSYNASFQFPSWPPGIPKGASSVLLTSFGKVLLRRAVYSEEPLRGTAPRGYGWSSDDNAIPSFSYFYAVTGDMSRGVAVCIASASRPPCASSDARSTMKEQPSNNGMQASA